MRWSIGDGIHADSAASNYLGWQVIGCDIGHCCRNGVRMEGHDGTQVLDNFIEECGIDRSRAEGAVGSGSSASSRSSGISFPSSTVSALVDGNTVVLCGEKNLLDLGNNVGITGTVTVSNNVSDRAGEFGINIKGANAAGGVIIVEHNLFLDQGECAFSGQSQGAGRLTTIFRYNMCIGAGGHQLRISYRPRVGESHQVYGNVLVRYNDIGSTANHRDEAIEFDADAENVFFAANLVIADRDGARG